MDKTLYYTSMLFRGHTIWLAANEQGLVYVGTYDAGVEQMLGHFKEQYDWREAPDRLAPYCQQLEQYAKGERREWTLPIVWLEGTAFQRKVWQALTQLAYGQTVSYGAIARAIEQPTAVRAVGGAIGKNPLAIVVPCHRVIQTDGQLGGYSGGLTMKRDLLQLESSNFDKID